MIFVDSKFDAIVGESENIKILDFPTSIGANAVISKRAYPPTEKLLGKHNEDGSVFVSIVYNHNIKEEPFLKMVEHGFDNKLVIFLGTPIHKDGYVFIEDYLRMPEADYMMAKAEYVACGTTVYECPDYCLERLLESTHLCLNESKFRVFKTAEYEFVDDWRALLSTMPLMTRKKVEYIYEKYKHGGFVDAVNALTDPSINQAGFGKVMCAALRDWLGIPDGWKLSYELIEE